MRRRKSMQVCQYFEQATYDNRPCFIRFRNMNLSLSVFISLGYFRLKISYFVLIFSQRIDYKKIYEKVQ